MDIASYNFLKDTVAKTGKSVKEVWKWMLSLCNTEDAVKSNLEFQEDPEHRKQREICGRCIITAKRRQARKESIERAKANGTYITMEEYMKRRNEQIKERKEKSKNEKELSRDT